jgi:hypothetical protein
MKFNLKIQWLPLMLLLAVIAGLVGPAQAAGKLGEPPTTPQSPSASVWTKTFVDQPPMFREMGARSLRFTNSGFPTTEVRFPAVAYGGNALYYAWKNGDGWHRQLVDASPGVGQFANLALDAQSRPRITYFDSINGVLKFAYSNDPYPLTGSPVLTWVITTVPALPAALAGPEVPVEPMAPRLAAFHNWGRTAPITDIPVPDRYGYGMYNSITVDRNNRIHISYYDANHGSLVYGSYNGLVWDINEVIDRGVAGTYTAVATRSDNIPCVSYFAEKYDFLKVACRNSLDPADNTWWIGTADNSTQAGVYTSLAFDSSDRPHVSYMDFVQGNLMYASQNSNGDWFNETVDTRHETGGWTSLALDGNSKPCVSYFEFTDQILKYACRGKSGWSTSVISNTAPIGLYTSLALNPKTGGMSISYYDQFNGRMVVTNLSAPHPAELVSTARNVGTYNSLSLDPATNQPYIAYFAEGERKSDASSRGPSAIKVAAVFGPGPGPWVTGVLTDAISIPAYVSVKKKDDSYQGIAYYNPLKKKLKYAFPSGGGWASEVVDRFNSTTEDNGMFPSLQFSKGKNGITNGAPMVSYYNATYGVLRFAYRRGVQDWLVRDIDTTSANVGQYTSMAISPGGPLAGLPAIAYYDAANKRLKYAYNTPLDIWEMVVVDITPGVDVGQYASLAFAADGTPHIAYYDATNANLKHAYLKNPTADARIQANWVIDTIDTLGDVGRFASIGVSQGTGTVHIAYYDATNHSLRYARSLAPGWQIDTIDSYGLYGVVGEWASLAVTSTGEPRISYYDWTNGALKYASPSGAFPVLTRNFLSLGIH